MVCPNCEGQAVHAFIGPDVQGTKCNDCSIDFFFLFATTRAKRSRGDRNANSREFNVRVYLSDGSEDLIQFVKSGWDDIELRVKDDVVFSYLGDDVRIVQNIQIGSYTSISVPSCYIATHIFGANSQEVMFLRKWRDRVLNTSSLGRLFVKLYYVLSPVLLTCLGNNKKFSQKAKQLLGCVLKGLGFK